jgi:hypothetical protein
VFNATRGQQLVKIPIPGTGGAVGDLAVDFELNQWKSDSFEFRVFWSGVSDLEMRHILLKRN